MNGLREILDRLGSAARSVVRNDAGGAIVEMAISSAILFATFFGVFEVTMACYTYNAVDEAARESVRWAVVRGTKCSTYTPGLDHCGASPTDIQNHAQAVSMLNWSQCTTSNPCVQTSYLLGNTVTDQKTSLTTTTWATCAGGCSADPKNLAIVTVTYPYTLTFPFVKTFNINLTSTAEMVVSQ